MIKVENELNDVIDGNNVPFYELILIDFFALLLLRLPHSLGRWLPFYDDRIEANSIS